MCRSGPIARGVRRCHDRGGYPSEQLGKSLKIGRIDAVDQQMAHIFDVPRRGITQRSEPLIGERRVHPSTVGITDFSTDEPPFDELINAVGEAAAGDKNMLGEITHAEAVIRGF